MSLNYNPRYQELCEQMNPYLVVVQMAKESRSVCKSLDNRILTSTALDYIAKNKLPNPKDFPDHRLDRVREYLHYVVDTEIRSAVLASYAISLKKNNLVYEYRNVEDMPRRARIRVILNILWDSRPHKK